MLSGCVACGTENIKQVNGTIGSSKYQSILETNVTQPIKKLKLKCY